MKEELLKIITHYGVNHQQRKLEEEVFELQEAITEYKYVELYKNSPGEIYHKERIREEIADVVVMLKQLQYYYEIDDLEVEHIVVSKILRQLERMKNERNKDLLGGE